MSKKMINSGNYKNLFKGYSKWIWNDLKKRAYRGRLEEEYTTLLLDRFAPLLLSESANIFRSIDESTNGNDIELFIEGNKNELIAFPIQAKRIYQNNIYQTLRSVDKQMQSLINYAENRWDGFPLYLFYNSYSEEKNLKKELKGKINFNYKYLGCSLVSAYDVKQFFEQKSKAPINRHDAPHFLNFHPEKSQPIYILGQYLDKEFGYEEFKEKLGVKQIKTFAEKDIIDENTWKRINYARDFRNDIIVKYRKWYYFIPIIGPLLGPLIDYLRNDLRDNYDPKDEFKK